MPTPDTASYVPDTSALAGLGRPISAHRRRLALRRSLDAGHPVVVPGVTDAMGLRLVERSGFEAAYATGAGLANAVYGLPDIGLVTQTEVAEHVGRLTASSHVPLVVDADTGYGGALSAMRTVRLLERAGAAGIQLEDQEMPKRCGHFDDHRLIPAEHMQSKIRAVLDAREDDALVIVARTDARSAEGIDEALRRGRLYLEAGADVLFVEAPRTVEELQRVGRELGDAPLVVNVVEGGKTPELNVAEYAELGFRFVLYANFVMRSMMKAAQDALTHLHDTGGTSDYHHRIAAWNVRQELFNLSAFQQADRHYDRPWSGADGTVPAAAAPAGVLDTGTAR